MHLSLLKCKIHRATVTAVHLDYEGSCAVDTLLMEAAGLREFEQIHLWNVTNGERLITYVIKAQPGSGIISVNGSAAHKANPGDIVIIAAFASLASEEAEQHHPTLVYVDANNRVKRIGESLPLQAA